MVGEFPGLETGLDDDGNVRATSDFRGVYAALLEQWFGVDGAAVIPKAASFGPAEARRVIADVHASHPPARVQVVAQEFRYSLSWTTVTAGFVIVELVNRGEDATTSTCAAWAASGPSGFRRCSRDRSSTAS